MRFVVIQEYVIQCTECSSRSTWREESYVYQKIISRKGQVQLVRCTGTRVSYVYVSCEEQKRLRDAIFDTTERLDLLFGKHITVHKTQNLAESTSSDIRSPKVSKRMN